MLKITNVHSIYYKRIISSIILISLFIYTFSSNVTSAELQDSIVINSYGSVKQVETCAYLGFDELNTNENYFICDGENDHIQANQAINYILNQDSHGTVYWEEGVYHITGPIPLKSRINHIGQGVSKTILDIEFSGDVFTSSLENVYSPNHFTIQAISGDRTLDNNGGYSVGDFIKLVDEESVSYFKKGEIVKVKEIEDSKLVLNRPLSFDYISNSESRKINMYRDFTISGMSFYGTGIETDYVCFSLYGGNNVIFDNIHLEDWGRAGISLVDSINITIKDSSFDNIYKTGLGYSIVLSNACDEVNIINCDFGTYGRHYIATGASTGTLHYGGWVKRTRIENCRFQNVDLDEEAVNAHNNGYGPMEVINCYFDTCGKGVETSNMHTIIEGCTFTNVIIPFHFIDEQGYEGTKTYSVKDSIINPVSVYPAPRSIVDAFNVQVTNSEFNSVFISIGDNFAYNYPGYLQGYLFENNEFKDLAEAAMTFYNCDNITLNNNIYTNTPYEKEFINCGSNITIIE